jgi:hypothetical protein
VQPPHRTGRWAPAAATLVAVVTALGLIAACSHGAASRLDAEKAAGPAVTHAAPSRSAVPTATRAASPLLDAPLTGFSMSPKPTATRLPTPTPVASGPVLPHGEVLLPSWPGNQNALALVRDARFVGDPATHCVWMVAGTQPRIPVLWPAGYRARFLPLRIYDEQDREVWREGQAKDVGGGGAGYPERVPPPCRDGKRVFWIWPIRPGPGN